MPIVQRDINIRQTCQQINIQMLISCMFTHIGEF